MKNINPVNPINQIANPGDTLYSSARVFGEKIRQTLESDPEFYLFSPDETTSNKLDAAYQATSRAWLAQQKDWDLPESADGRIIELLSENVLFSCMVGHVLSGKQALMTSYEAFFNIIISQILQHVKFIVQSEKVAWQSKFPAINLLSTSTCWRQDHNGFSHQSPALISALLANPSQKANCFFPVDSVSAATTFDYMINSKSVVNLTTLNKTEEPIWIDSNHAQFQLNNGASIFGFASHPDFADDGYIFAAAGDIVTREMLFAIKILQQDLPNVKIRFIGVNALSHNAIGTTEQPFSQQSFTEYFGQNSPIIANFHGYAQDFKNILSQYTNPTRIFAHGYCEQGSTTTPFEMLALNQASRYDICAQVADLEGRSDLVKHYHSIIQDNRRFAIENGIDSPSLIKHYTF